MAGGAAALLATMATTMTGATTTTMAAAMTGAATSAVATAVTVAAVAALAAGPAAAQDIGARAFLSAPEVGVGSQFVLNVEVTGTQQLDADPVLPDMEEFAAFLGAGTSTSLQIVGGRTSMAVTYQYRFRALAEGTFEIGAVGVTAGDRTVRTEPVTLMVSDSPGPAATGGGTPDQAGVVGPGDLFVETLASSTRVYENEPIAVEYQIFTRVPVQSYTITALPQATGFWSEELDQPSAPQTSTVVRDGSQYLTATIRRMILFGTGPGTKVLDPMEVEAQVRVRSRSAFDPFGDLMDFPSILDNRVPVSVTSRPVEVEVIPLPAEGRPGSFSGHVGQLSVAASLSAASAEVNEAVTLTVEYTGTGNLRTLAPPQIDFPAEFEAFPPEVSDRIEAGDGTLRGTRTYEYVLIPRAPGELALPAIETSYFDPALERYATTRSGAVAIGVVGEASPAGASGGAAPSAVETLRDEIRFIHMGDPQLRPVNRSLRDSASFWIVLLLPLVAVGGATVLRGHRDRMEGDVAYARVRRANRMARKRLARARRLATGDRRAFYAEVAGSLQGLLADKLNIAEAGLVREEAGRLAARRGVSAATLERLFACLDDCDRQRFAPAGADRKEPDKVLRRAALIMRDLDRELAG